MARWSINRIPEIRTSNQFAMRFTKKRKHFQTLCQLKVRTCMFAWFLKVKVFVFSALS